MTSQFLDIFFVFLLLLLASSIILSACLVYDVISGHRRALRSAKKEHRNLAEEVKSVRNQNLGKVK